jgi:spermidine synthase
MRIFSTHSILPFCVFLSGATALVAQMCLSRYLATLIGASSLSVALIVLLFFVGMALGALFAPHTGCARRQLVAIEGFVALWCAFIALCYYALDVFFIAQLIADNQATWQPHLLRVLITGFWVFPITMAFGMHFPVVVRVLAGLERGNATASRHLYTVNILGSALAAFAIPYTAFYGWGMQYTLLFFAGVSALAACALWRALPPLATTPPERAQHNAATSALPWPIGAISFASGALFFYLEMLWLHLVGTVVPANVYAYSKLIGIVLVSLALGGVLAQKFFHRSDALSMRKSVFTISCALAALLPLSNAAWPYIGLAVDAVAPASTSYALMEIFQCLILAAVMIPVATLAGAYYPTLFNALNYQNAPSRSHMARLLFLNTAGCIVGSLLAIYIGIPYWGSERSLSIGWACVGMVTLLMWVRYRDLRFSKQAFLIVIGISSALALPAWDTMELVAGRAIYRERPYAEHAFLSRLDEEFNSGFLAVRTEKTSNPFTRQPVSHTMVTNGKFEVNDSGHLFHYMAPAIVASLHVRKPENALIIGIGTGYSSWVVHALGFTSVDIAEISRARILQAEQYFHPVNHGILHQKGVHTHHEDGRNFLATHRKRYDVITVDLNAIWLANTTNLYSQEFYRLASQRLGKYGVFEQFFPVKNLDYSGVMMLLATAQSQFRYVALFNVRGLVFMLASNSPLRINEAMLTHYQTMPYFTFERSILPIHHATDLTRMQYIAPAQMSALLANYSGALNTDKNRFIEFQSPFMHTFTLEAFFKQFAPKP